MRRYSFLRGLLLLLLIVAAAFSIYYLLDREAAIGTLEHAVSTVQSGMNGLHAVLGEAMPKPFTGELQRNGGLEIYFIDVGQGNSALLISPSGKTMLIDAGEADAYAHIAALMRAKGIRQLDAAVATHPHNDHIGAMSAIITHFSPACLYMPDVGYDSLMYEEMLTAVSVRGVDVRTVYAGDTVEWDEAVGINVLSPIRGTEPVSLNDWSIVLRIAYGGDSLLLMGDAENAAEALMLGRYRDGDLDSDVLQLGHHGADDATGEAFLLAVSPEAAVSSCGKDNEYGHPDRAVLLLLDKYGVPLYRTDRQGVIHMVLSGSGIVSEAEK